MPGSHFLIEVAGLRPVLLKKSFIFLLKKRLWHRCFPVNFVKFLRTTFLYNTYASCFWLQQGLNQKGIHDFFL